MSSVREDGLHPITSLFQQVSLHDELIIQTQKERTMTIESSIPELRGGGNILTKIYHTFKEEIPFGVNIQLNKRIPLGGGLGGGSSNAAVFLRFLNDHAGWDHDLNELCQKGAMFGSDIPFFFYGGTVLVEGVGDHLTPVEPTDYSHFLLINPNLHSDTAQAYADFDHYQSGDDGEALGKGDQGQRKIGRNDLKRGVFNRIPELGHMETILHENGYPNVFMSGSGATLFIPFMDEKDANDAQQKATLLFPNYFIRLVSPN